MSANVAQSQGPALSEESAIARFFRATEIDTRMIGMIVALLVIWVGFDIYSGILRPGEGLFGGTFLTPRNLWILLVQTSSIAVMTTGMVLVIVMRQIDLSVGSILGFVAVIIGTAQVFWMPALGFPVGHPMIWIITLMIGISVGAAIGAFHGTLIAYAGIPSFIVTLGGLIVWRGAAWAVIRGETVAPMDKNFKLIGGGFAGTTPGSIGATASWTLGFIACALVVPASSMNAASASASSFRSVPSGRKRRSQGWAALSLLAQLRWSTPIPGPKAWLTATSVSEKAITVAARGIVHFTRLRGAGFDRHWHRRAHDLSGHPHPLWPLCLCHGRQSGSSRTGRYQHQETDGHDLCADGRACRCFGLISSARLNSATNALGQFDELYVIAAAVIGGTSLAGGLGTIYGAMLGPWSCSRCSQA